MGWLMGLEPKQVGKQGDSMGLISLIPKDPIPPCCPVIAKDCP